MEQIIEIIDLLECMERTYKRLQATTLEEYKTILLEIHS